MSEDYSDSLLELSSFIILLIFSGVEIKAFFAASFKVFLKVLNLVKALSFVFGENSNLSNYLS
jgi:hypothetical protein